MVKKLDLAKTQFLIEGTSIRFFRRKSVLFLFGKEGNPIRPITHPEWFKLQKEYPAEVKAEGLSAHSVWTLEEFKR